MNIFMMIILLSMQDIPALPEYSMANRRAQRQNYINRNKALYHSCFGNGVWFETADNNGNFTRWASGHHHTNSQQGRWDDFHFGGHRRFAKWEKKAYPSDVDRMGELRWEEELKEYFNS